jgi:hypothetical protein
MGPCADVEAGSQAWQPEQAITRTTEAGLVPMAASSGSGKLSSSTAGSPAGTSLAALCPSMLLWLPRRRSRLDCPVASKSPRLLEAFLLLLAT